MRSSSRRGSDASEVSLLHFAWPRATLATLRHTTLPDDAVSSASPLAETRNLGARDRLSLTGQFAAHVALLQFAGVADDEFEISEWVVVRKRGVDCRLVRVASRDCDGVHAPLEAIQQFATAIDAPAIDALQQSWTRAESVYAEVRRRLRDDASADIRWLQRAASAELLWPGAASLDAMWRSGGPHFVDDPAAFRAYASLDSTVRLVELGTEFPIQRYGALSALDESIVASRLTPAAVADRVMQQLDRSVVVVSGKLDEDSRRVIEIVRADRGLPSVTPERRTLVLSTRIAAQRVLEQNSDRKWVEQFVCSPAYEAFLEHGTLPVDDSGFASTKEPERSYIAALALLGVRVPRSLATEFLRQFLFERPLEELVVAGITSCDEEAFWFASEAIRAHCARHIPESSRAALCCAAASAADAVRAGLLLIESGDVGGGVAKLEAVAWPSAIDAVDALTSIPCSALSTTLAATLANALVDCGRYRDARDISPLANPDDAELILARCERRTGDYDAALARLDRLQSQKFNAQILRIELLRLAGREDEAKGVDAVSLSEKDQERLDYERALLDLDVPHTSSDPYLAARLATYRALQTDDYDAAIEHAARSVAAARCATERIDADVDRVFASFSAGRWDETRAVAFEALASIDEAQGDRAAAGILFTLTFLEIDDGRWRTATQHLDRLRRHYANDPHRTLELDLLSSYLAFTRTDFEEARRLAAALLQHGLLPQIAEAAALILDEMDWIEQRKTQLRSRGNSCNRELDERHRLMRFRRGLYEGGFASGFMRALASWEQSPESIPPVARTRSEKLKVLRSALGIDRKKIAAELATELAIALAPPDAPRSTTDVDVLRIAASANYPFAPNTFAVAWCHATRNRLGHWSQEGSQQFDTNTLDRVASAVELDWLRPSDRELLFIDGSSAWPPASREAVAALFRMRAENYRLRRVVEQEDTAVSAKQANVEGVVGESPAMRAVFALVAKIGARDVPVCILGESGTGKELIGRAVHRASPRRSKPFTAINCAALPENLIESELFGHVRGAFTGADRDRAGVIETTDGGTLFLDEIGEMPITAQAKLLRFLQDGEFRRVGDSVNRRADVRIVSATNRKLEAAVEEGRFREDLYYRVRGIDITLPPLRERGNDVMLLAAHFLEREHAKHRSGPQSFAAEVEMLLQSYKWPGNVRELQNTIRAAHAMAGDKREIDLEHLPERVRNVRPVRNTVGSYQDEVARFRRDLIEKSLAAVAGNQNRAAALLKISRQALAYQIRELGIMVGKRVTKPSRAMT